MPDDERVGAVGAGIATAPERQAGDNPRVVADKLTSFVPPAERDGAGEADNVTPMPEREAEAA